MSGKCEAPIAAAAQIAPGGSSDTMLTSVSTRAGAPPWTPRTTWNSAGESTFSSATRRAPAATMPASKHSISGFTPAARISVAQRSMNWGELMNTAGPKFIEPQSSDASSGRAATDPRRSSSDMPTLPPVV